MKWVSLMIGGCAGTLSRYFLAGVVYNLTGPQFPYGTLVVNLSGCFLIGFLAVFSEEKFLLSPNMRLLLLVGFCGAFTTFSTFIFETANLIQAGNTLRAFINVMSSVLLGFIVFRFGVLLAKFI